jgi:hypothetical protein
LPLKRALIVAIVVAVAAVVTAVVLVLGHNGPVSSVSALSRGDCVDAPGYLSGSTKTPQDLSRVDCDSAHDAEVLTTVTLSSSEASAYRSVVPNEVCMAHLDTTGSRAVNDMALLLAGVVDSSPPASGDALACLAFKADGSRLDGRVRTR